MAEWGEAPYGEAAYGDGTAPTVLTVTLAGVIPATTGAFNIVVAAEVITLAGVIPATTGAFNVVVGPPIEVTLAGVIPATTGAFAVTVPPALALDGMIPATTGAFEIIGSYQLALDGVIPATTGAFTLDVPAHTITDNRVGGRTRDGLAYGFYDPPVIPPPGTPGALIKYVALAYDAATVDTADGAARAVLSNVRTVEGDRDRYRVLVGGMDITYWRGTHTPRPSYSYIEPLLYGPGSLQLPQVVLPYEVPGRGALAFLDKGSPVRVQAIDPDTGAVTGPDLWRGVIVKHNMQGRVFTAELGGEASGRAGIRDIPQPLFRRRNDLGFWAYAAIRDLGLPFQPHLGPDTGLVSYNWGGTSYLDYIQEVCARAVARSGAQWTIMPGSGGHYRLRQKDLTTRDCTIYLDDQLAVAALTSDLAEEPNEVYASGSTVSGNRINFAVYPGLVQGPPPPYPFTDERTFGEGTTDGDTDTGDGISVMLWKLTQMGYLDLDDRNGTYDAAVTKAVKHLQQDAATGPTFITGDMDTDTWDALYDLGVTGASLAWSHIEPAAQWRATRKYRRSAAGSVIALNPAYDRSIPRVSASIEVGPGWKNRAQIKDFADGELTPEGEHHWQGTITLPGRGIILGDHNPSDPLTDADVSSSDAIQAGWNAWLPLFDEGVLVHISAVAFDATGVPTLTVDTRGRDARKVWEVIRRNRDSRVNLSRAWEASHRSSGLTKDTVTEFDGAIGGKVSAGVTLAGGGWTVFQVVAGQEGTIRTLRLITDPPTEFVALVFGKEVQPAHLAAVVPNPLTKAGSKRWNSTEIKDRLDEDVLLYITGDHDNPAGYWPRTKQIKDSTDGGVTGSDDPNGGDDTETDENADGDTIRHNPLTGKWRDDAGFPFRTYDAPVVYVAVFARHTSTVDPGRVLWPVNDPGS